MTRPEAPPGLSCSAMAMASVGERAAARRFCLEQIKEVYGTDYRADWHADLDSLTGEAGRSWFDPAERGAFWVLSRDDGAIVATAGLYRLHWKPKLLAALAHRYPQPQSVVQLARVYVRQDHRGHGIGRWLTALAEAEARRLAYATLYLHANADTPATIAFWRSRGFDAFESAEGTTHFDKRL